MGRVEINQQLLTVGSVLRSAPVSRRRLLAKLTHGVFSFGASGKTAAAWAKPNQLTGAC